MEDRLDLLESRIAALESQNACLRAVIGHTSTGEERCVVQPSRGIELALIVDLASS
jgi:hypothetical protein